MLKRFLSYYKPQMGLFVADTVCALVLAAIDLAFPIILRNLTGGLFTQGQAAIMQALGIEQKQFPINMIRSKISSAKNAMIGPEDMLKSADSPNDKKAAQVYLELERRLRGRGTETEESIQERLATARQELAEQDKFTVKLVNNQIEPCAAELYQVICQRAGLQG